MGKRDVVIQMMDKWDVAILLMAGIAGSFIATGLLNLYRGGASEQPAIPITCQILDVKSTASDVEFKVACHQLEVKP